MSPQGRDSESAAFLPRPIRRLPFFLQAAEREKSGSGTAAGWCVSPASGAHRALLMARRHFSGHEPASLCLCIPNPWKGPSWPHRLAFQQLCKPPSPVLLLFLFQRPDFLTRILETVMLVGTSLSRKPGFSTSSSASAWPLEWNGPQPTISTGYWNSQQTKALETITFNRGAVIIVDHFGQMTFVFTVFKNIYRIKLIVFSFNEVSEGKK